MTSTDAEKQPEQIISHDSSFVSLPLLHHVNKCRLYEYNFETNIHPTQRLCEWASQWMFFLSKMSHLYLIWRVDRAAGSPRKHCWHRFKWAYPGKQLLAFFYLLFGRVYLNRVIGFGSKINVHPHSLPNHDFKHCAFLFILWGSSCGLVSTNEREPDRAKDLHSNTVIILQSWRHVCIWSQWYWNVTPFWLAPFL